MNDIELGGGRTVPVTAVAALDELERQWPGSTLPQARAAIVAAVLAAVEYDPDAYMSGYTDGRYGE